jgi:predicted ATPase
MGKTLLMERFCATASRHSDAVVLSGRCYERESVPYKAIDGVIDMLSRHLRKLEPEQAAALMPRDVQLVARLFPVLSRVPSVAAAPRRDLRIDDPQQLRNRAFSALAELLGRIADRQRLILTLDDLQWMDKDSARLLIGVLGAAEPPGLLLIGSYRAEEAEDNDALLALRTGLVEVKVQTRSIAVGPLSDDDVRALLRQAQTQIHRPISNS